MMLNRRDVKGSTTYDELQTPAHGSRFSSLCQSCDLAERPYVQHANQASEALVAAAGPVH